MSRTRKLTTICCAAVLSLGLAACGGGDSTPVTETQEYMDLKQMADQYKGQVMQLETTIGSADDAADMSGSLHAQINYHSGEATRLSGMIGAADDAADMNGSLHAQINYHSGEVTRLNGVIGSAGDAGDAAGSLHAQINFHSGEATRLDGEVTDLKTMIGSADDAADMNGSLYAQINYWKAKAESLSAGTDPGQLEPIRTAANTASTNAGMARDDADTAAGEAETASENRATIQNEDEDGNPNSVTDAEMARKYAEMAKTEAKKASDAAQKAQDADNAADAANYRDMAQAAEKAANDAKMKAETARDNAVADAQLELKIDDTMKSVGSVSLDANAPNNVVTTGTGANTKTADTGLQTGLKPTQMVDAINGVPFQAAVAPAADTAYVQAVAERTVDIGKVVDSADDMARLMIVTQYAGSKNAKVYAYAEANPAVTTTANGRTGTAMGKVTVENNSSADEVTAGNHVNNTSLRSLGMYYLAGDDNTTSLAATEEVAADAKAAAVYSYVDVGTDRVRGGGDDTTVYLVMDSQSTAGSTTTYVYRAVDIDALASDATVEGTAEEVQVTAKLAEATDYEHIHFGVWAALGAAGAGGLQNPAGHGIGFVQSIGDGMTADDDMPNFGSATYNGNWAATVQEADPDGNGAISLTSGSASLAADFNDSEVMVTLTGLATLEGDISGAMFSGDKATVPDDNTNNLTGGEDFNGSFNGAFFGATASEAGGVFDFGSDDNEAGAFRGSFGGAR